MIGAELDPAEVDQLLEMRRSIDELRQVLSHVAETQIVYAHNLHCWANDVTAALNRAGRRFGIAIDPPVFPSVPTDGD